MSSLSDRIEAYLMHLLLHSKDGCVEVRRAEVADRFACVPSQVTYVLATRFTPERGFFVESRRGGGGYIRIVARHPRPEATGLHAVWQRLGRSLTPGQAEGLLRSLEQAGLLTRGEVALVRQTVRQEADWAEPPLCDLLRAAMIKGMLVMLSSSRPGQDRIG